MLLLTALLLVVGCSTKRNTGLSRGFQRMTTRYNVYLNGRYALEDAREKISAKCRDDYSHVLPVYEFYDKRNIGAGAGDLETVQQKAHKLVQLHSITVKPERKKEGKLSDKERRFYAKTEYNPLVPEGYLLMGEASVIQHEEDDAIKVFDFMGMEYGGERATYESKIWKAIAYTQKGYYNQALSALQSYDMDGDAPSPLYAAYQAALANVYVASGQYEQAIPCLQRAANEERKRHLQRRYTYILAQLYRIMGQKELAAPLFLKVSRQRADFEMSFAARLDLATVATTEEELAAAEKKLEKMTHAGRYPDQQDQIWYALAHIQKGRGNEETALDYFHRSVRSSTENENQKGLSWLAIGDIEQARPKYLEAGEALDSASAFLDSENVRKQEADERAALLHPLRVELQTIKDNDSLLAMARMDEKERNKILDALVKADKDRREAARQAAEMGEEGTMSQGDFYNLQRGQQSAGRSSFYFYNLQLVTAGKATFRSKWGNRKNEDDWRRSDKSTMSLEAIEEGFEELDSAAKAAKAAEELKAQMAEDEANAPLTREKLLAGLPLTAAQQAETDAESAAAFLKSASILYDQVQDYPSADAQIEEMLRRYPRCSQRYDALALRHFIAKRGHLGATQKSTDQALRNEYPESLLAKSLANKGLLDEMSAARSAREAQYKTAYEQYLRGEIGGSISGADRALSDSSTEKGLRAQYLLVRGLSHGKNGDAARMRTDLETIGAQHKGTPQDSLARLLLAELDAGRMPVRYEHYDSPLDKLKGLQRDSTGVEQIQYAYEPDSAHVIVCLVATGRLRDAQFTVANYNFTNFLLQDYDIVMKHLPGDEQCIIIAPFKNNAEAERYFYALRDQPFWPDLAGTAVPKIWRMSRQNLALLQLSGVDEAFTRFMYEYYPR